MPAAEIRYRAASSRSAVKVLKDLVNRAFRQAGFVLHRIPTVPDQESAYLRAGRIPWGPGYDHARFGFVRRAVDDPTLLEVFRTRGNLPQVTVKVLTNAASSFPGWFHNLITAPDGCWMRARP